MPTARQGAISLACVAGVLVALAAAVSSNQATSAAKLKALKALQGQGRIDESQFQAESQ